MRPRFPILLISVVSLLIPCRAVQAQTTRVELIEQQRAEKAARLEPYKPGRLEKFFLDAKEGKLRRMISPYNGFFAEYRLHLQADRIGHRIRRRLPSRRAQSAGTGAGRSRGQLQEIRDGARRGRGATLGARTPLSAARASTVITLRNDYYGLGDTSVKDERVSFGQDDREVQGHATYSLTTWLNVGARGGWLSPTIDEGRDTRYPSIEQIFDDSTAPGLAGQPDFTYTEGFAEVDYRDEPGNARSGGYYLFSMRRYNDRDLDRYSFRTTNLTLQQFVPLFDKKRVFAFQVGLATTNPGDGQQVPFYLQPTLGGSRTLRSESDYRYRDQNVLWMNADYRWEAFSALDMALFTDWGNVAPEFSDLSFTDLKRAYGIGFRFNTAQAVFLRFDIAAGGNDGIRYFFKFSKAF